MKKRLHQKLALLCSLALMAGSIPATGLMPACALEAEEAVQMSEELPAESPEVSAEGEALPEAEPWLPEELPVAGEDTDTDVGEEPAPELTDIFTEDVFEEDPEFPSLPGEEIPDVVFEELIEDEEAITEWSDPAWEDEESGPVMEEEASEEADIPGEDELILEESRLLGEHALCELTVSYTNASFDEDLQPCGDLIDLGTLDLSKREFEASKDVYIVNTSFTNETDTINGLTEQITVYSGVSDAAGVFLGSTNTSWGRILTRRMKSETVPVAVNVFDRIAGTYYGSLWIGTEPESTVINGGMYNTGSLEYETGEYTLIPVKVTLTGINPDLPGRVENLQAEAGNGSVRLAWDALDDFDGSYSVYRREGVETETNPDLYSEETYQWVEIEAVEGGETVSFTDTTVTNGVTYSYCVIAGARSYAYPPEPTHLGCGYACQAVSVTPDAEIRPRPEAPALSGGSLADGVDLAWTLQDPEENGEGEIDYFKVFRNGQYVARVDRSSAQLDTSNGEYRWDVTVHCDTTASYTWWVTAVDLEGMESYESNCFENELYYNVPVVTGHHAWYTEEWDYDDLTDDIYLLYRGICISVEVGSEASAEKVRVWRDGAFLGEVDKNQVTGDSQYDFLDKTVEYGKTYTYEIVVTDWNEKESERYAFQIRTPANEQAYEDDTTGEIYASRSTYEVWTVLGGTTQKLKFYGYANTTYILYRNDQALKTWIHPSGEVVYKDTPDTDGTYVYRLGVLQNGVLFLGQEQTFVRNTQEAELPQRPGTPAVQGRIVNGQVWLSWEKGEGAEPDGYYVYRMDGDKLNTGRYNDHASGPELYEGPQGRYARLSPQETSFVDIVWWENEEYDPEKFPVTYWVCAYNQYGLSDVSDADKISFAPVDGQAPGNVETQLPGTPQIESVLLEAHEGYAPSYVDLTVSFMEPENGGGIDAYEIVFESVDTSGSTQTILKYPGIDSENGQIRASRDIFLPSDYGDYQITVTARNCVGAAIDTVQVSIREFPKFEAVLSDTQAGTALLSWEMAAGETAEDGFEIWRKADGGDWELLAQTEENRYTDTGLENGKTYSYYVCLAQAGSGTGSQEGGIILSGRSVVRSVTPSADYVQPGAPLNVHAAPGDGTILVYWDEPADEPEARGRTEKYIIQEEYVYDGGSDWLDLTPYYSWIRRLGTGSNGAVISGEYRNSRIRVTAVNQGEKRGESEPLQLSFTDEDLGQGSGDMPGVVWPGAESGDGQVTLKWMKPEEGDLKIAFFIIGRYRNDAAYSGGYDDIASIAAVDDPDHEYTWTDTDVVNGTRYQYRIVAQGKNGIIHNNYWDEQLYTVRATPRAAADTSLEAEQLEAVIDGLPEPADFDPANEEQAGAVRAAKALYYNLNAAGKAALDPVKKQKLLADIEILENHAAENRYEVMDDIVREIKEMIDSLPSAEDLTADTLTDELREKIDLIKGACDDLPDSALAEVDNIGRLTALEEKIKAIDDTGGNNPGGDNPGGDNPGGDTPGGDNPGGNTPGGDNPVGDNPGGNTPGGDNPGGNTPGGNTPGGNTPVNPGGTGGPASGGIQPAAGAPVGTSGIYGSGASLATYLVTGDDTVTYVKCQAAKKAKSLSVPDTVTINGKVYRVTAVAANAFARRDKATKISIGANVASIGAKAFNKCKKLKTLTVKSKLLTPAGCKKCLKGSSVTAVKVPKAKKKAYKKLFKKSVCGKNVKLK